MEYSGVIFETITRLLVRDGKLGPFVKGCYKWKFSKDWEAKGLMVVRAEKDYKLPIKYSAYLTEEGKAYVSLLFL